MLFAYLFRLAFINALLPASSHVSLRHHTAHSSYITSVFLFQMAAQFFNRIGQLGLGVALAAGVVNSALYNGLLIMLNREFILF